MIGALAAAFAGPISRRAPRTFSRPPKEIAQELVWLVVIFVVALGAGLLVDSLLVVVGILMIGLLVLGTAIRRN
jgi:hypothetical protein